MIRLPPPFGVPDAVFTVGTLLRGAGFCAALCWRFMNACAAWPTVLPPTMSRSASGSAISAATSSCVQPMSYRLVMPSVYALT